MFRRNLLATLLGLFPASGAGSNAVAIARTAADAVERTDVDGETGDFDGESMEKEPDGDSGYPDSEPSDDHSRTRTAVVDRVEGDVTVLLFEDGNGTRTVPTAALPPAAREAGLVLRVPQGNSLALATVDRAETARRRRTAGDRFDDLAEPVPDSADGENETVP